ncbi:GCN5 family N-acetyltransferase [Halolactibacillus alkaliphilus]|uniref:GCN5 family N-acetyltransferase n=2 Tax=Halolactibacillus alkaliphilus TaxID=442899 RepID=A0A511X0W9_9BACI|nr:GNAT family protein [Halolactibacillus alkaliphilus]GEN56596.1 GCN5 family N-acetyltransferase [Halolactibacillus alkaliphilus]GGN69697.1 GCN5 family N-acetyltransferase [Halolactibacillus alkaliphilus]SFO76333.1 Protein N-acetyltransferase, RimJ/RimL family [Halolactibacillus alkaliphilus]
MAVQVILRPLEYEDLPDVKQWYNDPSTLMMIGHTPKSLTDIEEMVEQMEQTKANIYVIESRQHEKLGWIHLTSINQSHGRAEIGLMLDRHHQGQGHGEAAMLQMLSYAFDHLRLNKVFLTTRGINEKARGLYEKLGFKIEGTFKDHCFVNGKYYDTYFMSLFESDWRH